MKKTITKHGGCYEPIEPCLYDKNGYEMIVLVRPDGTNVARYLDELVAETWVPNPDGKKFIRHKDGDIHNNCADNLEWVNEATDRR